MNKLKLGLLFIIWGLPIVGSFFVTSDLSMNSDLVFTSPSWQHLMGTDSLGRDLLSRAILGFRWSLLIVLGGLLFSCLFASAVGFLAGWSKQEKVDHFWLRVLDIWGALPSFIVVSVFCLSFSFLPDWLRLALALGLSHWVGGARLIRGQIKELKQMPYVQAAVALGASESHLFKQHILKALFPLTAIYFMSLLPQLVMYESFMSFIGLGLELPRASLGSLIQEGWRSFTSHPFLMLAPGVLLILPLWSLQLWLSDKRSASKGL